YLKDLSFDRLLQINGSKAKKIGISIALIYALIVTVGGFGFLFFNLAQLLSSMNQMETMISFLATYSLMIPIIMTLFRASGTLFFYKDYEILAALPIKSKTVLGAKLTIMFLWMYVTNIVFVVPILFSYFYFAGFDIVGLLIYLVASIVYPLVPIVILTFISLGIGYIATKFNFGKIIQIILLFVLFFGILYAQFSISAAEQNPLTGQIDTIAGISKYYPPIRWFQDAIYSHDWLSLLYLLLSHLAIFALFFLSIEKLSLKLNQTGIQKHVNKKVKMTKIAQSSVTKILIKKEFKKILSIPVYAINAGFGIVLLLVLSIASLFFNDLSEILATFELANIESFIVVSLVIGFVLALAYTPAITLSLEGKNFWILKSLPIKASQVMTAKIYFNILLFFPAIAVSIIFFSIAFGFSFIQVIVTLLLSFSLLSLISVVNSIVNLYFPKFDFKNEVEIVKQSAGALIGMLVGMSIVVVNGAIFYFITSYFSEEISFALLSLMNFLLIIPFYDIIKNKSEGIFKKL
ncbi:MAG: hypothetical protein WCR19_01485, partial [Acholeplasmataceae bacterium]